MNEEQLAINRLVATDEYKNRCDPATLGAPPESRQYLENRILLTFTDGMAEGRRIEREAIIDKLRRLFESS